MEDYRYVYETGKIPESFKKIPFLTPFSEHYLEKILQSARIREYKKNEVIIPEGDKDKWLYILLAGKVNVVKDQKHLTSFQCPGDLFGELALINNEARTASVVADGKTLCLAVDTMFMDELPENERTACSAMIYRIFAKITAERLKATSEELARVKDELERMKNVQQLGLADPEDGYATTCNLP